MTCNTFSMKLMEPLNTYWEPKRAISPKSIPRCGQLLPKQCNAVKCSNSISFCITCLKYLHEFFSLSLSSRDLTKAALGKNWTPIKPTKDLKTMKFWEINDSPEMISNPFSARLQFWDKIDIYGDIISGAKDEL